jgi:hypothetical protein
MPTPRMPSLQLLYDLAGEEQRALVGPFQSLDTKAGIVLAFAGVLVTLSGGVRSVLTDLGRVAAALSGLLALLTFLPRRPPRVDVARIRDAHLRSEESFTRLHVLDTRLALLDRGAAILKSKARRLGYGFAALTVAVVLLAGGMLR